MKKHDQTVRELIEKTKKGKLPWQKWWDHFYISGTVVTNKWRVDEIEISYKAVELNVSKAVIDELNKEIKKYFDIERKKKERKILLQLTDPWWKRWTNLIF